SRRRWPRTARPSWRSSATSTPCLSGRGDPDTILTARVDAERPWDKESRHDDSISLPDHSLWRLLSSRSTRRRHRADAHRPRNTLRRILSTLLAADLLLRRSPRRALARDDPRRTARRLPGPTGKRGLARAALPSSRDIARVWADLGARHPMLLP